MNVRRTAIDGVVVVGTEPHDDPRGSFTRFFCTDDLADVLRGRSIAQINHSRTAVAGAVRGLHFQRPPHAEMKLVRCLTGRVFDVAVDLRAESPSFLRWHGEELTPRTATMLVIPEGCAHGFQALEPQSELLYLHTTRYAPTAEDGIRFDDPRLAIAWPLPATALSERDRALPRIDRDFRGIQG